MSEINIRIEENAQLVEDALSAYLSIDDDKYPVLFEAMRYGVLGGGKRVRPFLALEFCRLFGGEDKAVMPGACALECIHSYSLVHDDLPCMDNDELRRGKPTNHVKFGEANALLCGDSLLTYAFDIASNNDELSCENVLRSVKLLTAMSGPMGMVGGQQIDLLSEDKEIDFETLLYLHSKKTGCLIKCAALLGCIAANIADDDQRYLDAQKYAEGIGLAFQIIDDILDRSGDVNVLGKPIGSDEDQNKTTFLSFMSIDEAYDYAKKLTADAIAAVEKYEGSQILVDFARMLLDRKK